MQIVNYFCMLIRNLKPPSINILILQNKIFRECSIEILYANPGSWLTLDDNQQDNHLR